MWLDLPFFAQVSRSVEQNVHTTFSLPNPDCRMANRQSTKKHNMYQLLYTYSIPPDDGLQICLKHVEVDWQNKLRINNASSWFSLHGGASYSPPDVIQVVKLSRIRLVGHVVHVRERTVAEGVFVGITDRKDHLEELGVFFFLFKEIYCTENSARYTRLQNCSFNQFATVVIRRSEWQSIDRVRCV